MPLSDGEEIVDIKFLYRLVRRRTCTWKVNQTQGVEVTTSERRVVTWKEGGVEVKNVRQVACGRVKGVKWVFNAVDDDITVFRDEGEEISGDQKGTTLSERR